MADLGPLSPLPGCEPVLGGIWPPKGLVSGVFWAMPWLGPVTGV